MDITGTIKAKLTKNGKGVDWTKFSNDDSLWEEGILDSLGMIELIQFIEKSFNIKVGDDDLSPENFDSISRISSYISVKMTMG